MTEYCAGNFPGRGLMQVQPLGLKYYFIKHNNGFTTSHILYNSTLVSSLLKLKQNPELLVVIVPIYMGNYYK